MMSAIVVHADFDHAWPWAADRMREIWMEQGIVQFVRLPRGDTRACHEALTNCAQISRLALFGVPFTEQSRSAMTTLREIAANLPQDNRLVDQLRDANVRVIWQRGEGFWSQSVAEFALALTICGLRRIPQTHHNIIADLGDWNHSQPDGHGRPAARGQQFADDPCFSNGTIAGKRVRIVGAGNIGSRYASFCHFLGADVAIYDPLASDPCFHRAGARREQFLERLIQDAEIFAPMLPLLPTTEGLITAEHIQALPKGTLVVMATRAAICDCDSLYKRVLNDELALAADVFDHEPIEIGHPLLGRHNVVHTPHNAGRTRDANYAFAQALADQFSPVR